jgi:hypothetical protein
VHKRNALSGGRDDRPQVSSLELLNTIQWNWYACVNQNFNEQI